MLNKKMLPADLTTALIAGAATNQADTEISTNVGAWQSREFTAEHNAYLTQGDTGQRLLEAIRFLRTDVRARE